MPKIAAIQMCSSDIVDENLAVAKCLIEKTAANGAKETNAEFPQKNGCIIKITTKEEQTFTCRIKDPKGSPQNLLTAVEVKRKFLANTFPVLGEEHAEHLCTHLEQFAFLTSVRQLHGVLAPARQTEIIAKL